MVGDSTSKANRSDGASHPGSGQSSSAKRQGPTQWARAGTLQTSRTAKRRRAATDELKLFGMGYRQELVRTFTLFNSFGVAFSILSPLTALSGTYGSWGLLYGGPVVMMWGLPVVSLLSITVAVSLSELLSAYPTSGGIYYWVWALAPHRWRTLLCWMCGWVAVLGQVSFIAANGSILVNLVRICLLMATGHELSEAQLLAIYYGVLLLCALASSASNHVMSFLTSLSTFWNLVALAALCVTLPVIAPRHVSPSHAFTAWEDSAERTGVTSRPYNALLGLLMSQYLFLGFDACAHVAEETRYSDINAPRGMVGSAVATAVGGYGYLAALVFITTDPAALLDPNNETKGEHPVAQLLWSVHKSVYGKGNGAVPLLMIPLAASLMCTYQCISANARMLYAFSRDGAVPFNKYIRRVEKRTQAPIAAVWVMALLAALLGTPMYFSAPYVATIESMAVVNTYLAYGLPIFFKLLLPASDFLHGPFYTGNTVSRVLNVVSVAWIATMTVIFSLPSLYPITAANMNYNSLGTGLVLLATLAVYYCPVVGGVHWFTGPRPNLGQFADETPSKRKITAATASPQPPTAASATPGGGTAAGDAPYRPLLPVGLTLPPTTEHENEGRDTSSTHASPCQGSREPRSRASFNSARSLQQTPQLSQQLQQQSSQQELDSKQEQQQEQQLKQQQQQQQLVMAGRRWSARGSGSGKVGTPSAAASGEVAAVWQPGQAAVPSTGSCDWLAAMAAETTAEWNAEEESAAAAAAAAVAAAAMVVATAGVVVGEASEHD